MSTEVSKPVSNTGSLVPAYMQNTDVMGTEALNQYVRPPRLKVIQAMAREPFDQYDPGTVLVVPQMMEFAKVDRATKKGEVWKFIPLFFYPEWVQTNPIELAGQAPFIRDRSLDPRSELAQKARNRETWFERHPEHPEMEIANRENMNFVVMPYNHSLAGTMCVLTFAKAGFREGSNLASMIKIRKAPIFGQVFEASSAQRKNNKGQWFGLDINIPAASPEGLPWVTSEEFEQFKELHLELVKTHKEGLLQVDYDDVAEEPAAATTGEF